MKHFVLPLLALFAAHAQADLLVVDPGGQGDYTELWAALQAAQDGDTIFVHTGYYFSPGWVPFVLDKDLTLVGEVPYQSTPYVPGAQVRFELIVQGLPAGKSVELSTLVFRAGLRIEQSPGAVRVEDSVLFDLPTVVEASDDVVFSRVLAQPGTDFEYDGLQVLDSSVAVYDSTFTGSHGDPYGLPGWQPRDGGEGCVVDGGFLFASGSTFRGGDGGNGHPGDPLDPGFDGADGGDGFVLRAGSAVMLDSSRVGGAAGLGSTCVQWYPNCGNWQDGQPGQDEVVLPGATLQDLAGTARRMEVGAWAEGTDRLSFTFRGQPGDQVFLPADEGTDFVYDAVWRGVWTIPVPGGQPPVATIPSSGSVTLDVDLPPGVTCDAVLTHVQAAFVDAQVERFLATPASILRIRPPATFPTTCSANPTSTGSPAAIFGSGFPQVGAQDLLLSGQGLPPNQFGYFLMSRGQAFVPLFGGSQGNLCLALPIYRFSSHVLNSGAGGSVQLAPDFGGLPGGQTFAAGDTWYFQLWFRDNHPGPTSNTTEALVVTFCQ